MSAEAAAARLRVAVIVPGFSASEDDWCIPALLTRVRRLAAHVDLEIFTLRYPPRAGTYTVAGSVVHALGGGNARLLRRAVLLRNAVRCVTAAHRRRPFDLCHALWIDEPGMVALYLRRRLRLPVVASVMGGELVSLPHLSYGGSQTIAGRLLARTTLNGADRLTVGSRYLMASLPPSARARAHLLPLGVDAALFTPHGEPARLAGAFRILSVASLIPVKNHARLLEAMALVVRTVPAHLHIVGAGAQRDQLAATAARLDLGAAVTFHGEIAHDRLPGFYRAADVLAVPSEHESQCMAALEACACGTPVVGRAVGVIPELGGAAWRPTPDSAESFAAALIALAGDAERRREMAAAAPAVVRAAFDANETAASLVALFRDAVAARPTTA